MPPAGLRLRDVRIRRRLCQSHQLAARTGNWYLSKDVTLAETWEANGSDKKLNLCFNGHTVTSANSNTNNSLLRVFVLAKVNLTDCAATPAACGATAI